MLACPRFILFSRQYFACNCCPHPSTGMADVFKGLNLLETLKESLENNKLSDVKDAVEDLLISRINVAVAGDRVEEKATFINSLSGLGSGDEGAAPFPTTADPDEVAGYPNPKHPDFRLWDIPPVPNTSPFEAEGYITKFKFLRYNVVFMTFTEVIHPNCVAREAAYFVLLASKRDTEKSLEEKRQASLDVLKSQASMVDSSVAVRILTKAQLSLCLDD
ncbi:Interferon-inducible GTPase 1, partial [Oryzias melastigma]